MPFLPDTMKLQAFSAIVCLSSHVWTNPVPLRGHGRAGEHNVYDSQISIDQNSVNASIPSLFNATLDELSAGLSTGLFSSVHLVEVGFSVGHCRPSLTLP